MLVVAILGASGALFSYLASWVLIRRASALGLVDQPNNRSAHRIPTPKGGGLGFFISILLAIMGLVSLGKIDLQVISPLLYGGPVVVALGFMDDRFSLSARLRLFVHFAVAVVIFGLVTDWGKVDFTISFLPDSLWLSGLFCVFFIAWFINLFNFMDGADGLVTSGAVVGSGLMVIVTIFHGAEDIAFVYGMVVFCLLGFLPWNWSPAKIFMGDTGSYFLGFLFAGLALICKIHSNISFYSHIIIFAPFICDTTYTLGLRLIRGERVYQAHRQQAFHKVVDKGWTHSRVAYWNMATMVLWLFPLAHLASVFDDWGPLHVVVAYSPLLAFQVFQKAGLPEASIQEVVRGK